MRQVVVVGAGLAGLHAAWRLHTAGVDVGVLEARDRVGGRTWSHEMPDGSVVERGGEFIAPDHNVLRSLVDELGLALIPHGFSFDRRPTPDRAAPTEAELDDLAAAAGGRAASLATDSAVADVVSRPTPAQALALRRLETSLTVPLGEVSARRIFDGAPERYDPADRVRGGNQRVALELERRLAGRVRLGCAVVGARHSADGATVLCADGTRYDAAAVVLALPLPLLLRLDLEPGLPDEIRAAASRTRFGDAAKLHIPLAAPPRPGRMASPDALWWCWTSRAADGGPRAAPVLSCFAGGRAAISALGVEPALALRPDVAPSDGGALLTDWGAEPWTRGSYSVPGVGSTAADDAAWRQPWGGIVLAGEHTAGPQAGTMNGAAASGGRAAETVLRRL